MELTKQDLEIIARARMAKPYKKRLYISTLLATILMIGIGFPWGNHLWQFITVAAIAVGYFIYIVLQGKKLDLASHIKARELLEEVSEKRI